MNAKKLVVVLGMHRCGTSALTRGLQVMGVDLGDRMMPPVEGNNPKGFWEDIDLNALNIQMLDAIHREWRNLTPIEAKDVETLRNEGYFLRAVELLRKKVGGVTVFGFKDPRVAKLLPFWKEVFSHCKFDVNYVLAIRHPLSVVKSLAKRDGLAEEQSYLLWLGYVIAGLIGSAGDKRILVDYDRLMQSPDFELTRIANCMNLKIDPAKLQSYKTGFLDQGLRHTVYELNDLLLDKACPPIALELYDALLDAASDQVTLDDQALQNKISRWSDEFERIKSPLLLVDRLFTEKLIATQAMAERDGQIASLNQAVAERDGQIASLNQAVAERDGQIASLNQAVAEREGHIGSLGQALAEREGEIASLNEVLQDRDASIRKSEGAQVRNEFKLATLLAADRRRQRWLPKRLEYRAKLWYWQRRLKQCPLFDAGWYREHSPDVGRAGIDPLWHYLINGWKEGRQPGPEFDDRFYLSRNPDVEALQIPPLVHYWLHGRFERREINAALGALSHNPEVSAMQSGDQSREYVDSGPVLSRAGDEIVISVIIPTYNRVGLLPEVLVAWREVDARTRFRYEIIFSDDGSEDGTVELLEAVEDLPLRVLRNQHGGASRARNAAIRAASGDRLLIIGDDIFPDPEILNVHAALGRRLGPGVATLGTVDWHPKLPVNHLMHHITEIGNEQFSYNRLADNAYTDFRHFYTCNICVPRHLFTEERVLFDERFDEYGFEDIELGYRLSMRGMRLYFSTSASGAHYHPYTTAGFCRRQVSAGHMAVVFANIHPGVKHLIGAALTERCISGDDARWQSRLDDLVRRCDEYERLIALLPGSVSSGIRRCLSALYSHLFRAMYEFGVLQKLGLCRTPLAMAMSRHFKGLDESFWARIASVEEPIPLSAEELFNLGEALATGRAADLLYGKVQTSLYEELTRTLSLGNEGAVLRLHTIRSLPVLLAKGVYQLRHNPRHLLAKIRQAVAAKRPRLCAPSTAGPLSAPIPVVPALVLDAGVVLVEREEMINGFRSVFGESLQVYEHLDGGQPDSLLPVHPGATPTTPEAAGATVFFWPKTSRVSQHPDRLRAAYLALVENGLSFALISHSLKPGLHVSVGDLRDHLVFGKDVASAVFSNRLCEVPFSAKILRLLPTWGNESEHKIASLLGCSVEVNEEGFMGNSTRSPAELVRYKPPYLIPRRKSKPVVFVFPIFLAVGGVERNTVEIMRELNDSFDFIVITMERLRPEQGSLAAQAMEVASEVIEISEIVRHADYLRVLFRLKANYQPDLVWVCNGSPWFCDNAKAIREIFQDVPVIDQEVYDVERGWISRYGEPGIRSFDDFIAVNRKIEKRFLQDFMIDPDRVHLIYSAVDTARIRRFKSAEPDRMLLRQKFGLPAEKALYTFVARLTPQKQPIEFLKLAKHRLDSDDEFFVLVGDGELAGEAQAFIEKNDLRNVKRVPYIENTLELNAISSGIIFTSAFEGLPIAMLEAIAMGVPCFATDVGDIADVLAEYGGGIVVPVGQTDIAIHRAFEDWLEKRDDLAANLRNRENDILERFSSKNIARQYRACWETAMVRYGRTAA